MDIAGFFKNIWSRRVPQSLGLYIGATWMMIEIGDWVIERFLLAPEITSYIFLAMVSFVPSVILLAYQYGKPGKDPWHKSTFVAVPINLVTAMAIAITQVEPVDASEVKVAVDETGAKKEFIVPKPQYSKRVIAFFWQTDNLAEQERWLQFALPWLLSKDLERNEFISSMTAFEHPHLYQILSEAGYKEAINEPLALQLSMVQDHSREHFVTGKVNKQQNVYQLTAELRQVSDGDVRESITVSHADFFQAIDKLSKALSDKMIGFASREQLTPDLPVAEHVIAVPEALELTVNALLESMKQPYNQQYLESLERAHQLDPSSLEIQKRLFTGYWGLTKVAIATEYGEMALSQTYKMTRQERFEYQGYLYGIQGDQDSHLKILTLWAELYPNSVDALSQLARYQQAYAADLNVAEQSLLKVTQLVAKDMSAHYQLAKLFESMGNLEQAISSMQKVVELSSNNVNAKMHLAQLYEQRGEFKQARSIYQEVTLIEPNNVSAHYLAAFNHYKLGELSQAKKIIEKQLSKTNLELNHKAGFILLANRVSISEGKIKQAITRLDKLDLELSSIPLPSKLAVTIIPRIQFLGMLGESQRQIEHINPVVEQLEAPYNRSIESLLLGVYKHENNIDGVQSYIDKYESINQQEPTKFTSNLLEHAYLTLHELNQDYAQAKEIASIIVERSRKSAIDANKRLSYLARKVKLARLYYLNERYQESEMLLQEVLAEFPGSILAKKELATLYVKTNRFELAKKLDIDIMTVWKEADTEYIEFR
ncbi:MAG: tetratricopeptide repeat protein, partial [Kangiellaceae bacterium]|nr:tetratricopeptide repeat protein [Kangiellaceae bacterium]